jgi:uncharacterized protein YycO
MKFACYKGTSRISRAIRFVTRSEYSHVGLLLENGDLIEAWDSGVRLVKGLSDQHIPGTVVDVYQFAEELTAGQERKMRDFLHAQIGFDYDWKGVFRFITRKPATPDSDWFCSELAVAAAIEGGRLLFAGTLPEEVPPDWIPRSLALRFSYRTITT